MLHDRRRAGEDRHAAFAFYLCGVRRHQLARELPENVGDAFALVCRPVGLHLEQPFAACGGEPVVNVTARSRQAVTSRSGASFSHHQSART